MANLPQDLAYGITSRSAAHADARRLLEIIHWNMENSCHYMQDWNYDEDRCRVRTGFGPETKARLLFERMVDLCQSSGTSQYYRETAGHVFRRRDHIQSSCPYSL